MKSVLALLTAVKATQPSFEEWASEYGFNGDNNGDDDSLRANYEITVSKIAELEGGCIHRVNQFSGMSWDEFASTMLTFRGGVASSDLPMLGGIEATADVGDVDWDVTPVKDQGSCGSCWAFGTIAGIEAKHKQATSETVSLSEQQLVDCDHSCDGQGTECDTNCNCGCSGGQADWAYGNYLKSQAIYTEASYPYKASGGACQSGTDSGIRLSGFTAVSPMSDSALAAALNDGAVVVAIGANFEFQSYGSGILSNPTTSCSLNHQVMATGYGPNYWKIKNSWGSGWGEGGFIRFERATGGCGPFGLFTYIGVVPTLSASAVEV